MSKAWDILPPRRPSPAVAKKQSRTKKKSAPLIYLVFFIIFALAFLFGGNYAKLKFTTATPTNTASTTITPTPRAISAPKIKILNSTGRFEEAAKVKDLLRQNGFSVSASETAINSYDQTLIYYNLGFEKTAAQIGEILKSYNPKAQKFSQVSNYDIAIIIGGK